MNIEKILEYQALDQVIYKAEVEYANSDENKKYNVLRNRARACSEQLIKLDHETADIFKELDRKEAALTDFNAELKARPAAPKNLEQAGKSDDALKKLEEGLASLEKECNRLFKRLEEIARESQQYYSQFVKLRGEIDAANKARNEKRKQILSGIAEYGYKLNELKNTLDPADLEIYQKVRMSKFKLPIVVELKDGNCRGCGMHIETELHGKLVNPGDIAECPHCRRILYRK